MVKLDDQVVKIGMEHLGCGSVRGIVPEGVVVFWGVIHGTHAPEELAKVDDQ